MYHIFKDFSRRLLSFYHALAQDFRDKERHQAILWAPVALGIGISLYFQLVIEPPMWVGFAAFALGAALCSLRKNPWRLMGHGIFLAALGFILIQYRTHDLSTPMLAQELQAVRLEGTVATVEYMPKALRLTLSDPVFEGEQVTSVPRLVRITAKGRLIPYDILYPGQRVSLKATLAAPKWPVAPGGYDFRRKSYFDGIGAVGFALTPPRILEESIAHQTWQQRLAFWRHELSVEIRSAIPGQSGAIAAALVTGDRSAIEEDIRQAFADSGIAHILAISGLHLSIVAGIVFLVVRGLLSLIPPIALRFQTKKLAAGIAVLATFGYLMLCGATFPAQRAFIMSTIFLIAMLADRTALTLRNISLAATVILLLFPESIINLSFQLSFAAITAIVSGYEALRPRMMAWRQEGMGPFKKLMFYSIGIIGSSTLANLATTPIAIYTFHRFTMMGELTNLCAIPLVSFIIMPLLILFLISLCFGLQDWVAPLLDRAIGYMILAAQEVSSWPISVTPVPLIPNLAYGCMIFGMITLCLLKSKVRHTGFVLMVLGTLIFIASPPPDLYINQDQSLIALKDSMGKSAISTKVGGRFARENWGHIIAARDSEKLSEQGFMKGATYTWQDQCLKVKKGSACVLDIKTPGKKHLEVVYRQPSGTQRALESGDISEKGGYYFWLKGIGVKAQSVRDVSGYRPWTPDAKAHF